MDRFRLKNIIILILLLVNGFLLGTLAVRKSAEQEFFRRTAEQLVELFEADGISLDVYAISRDTPPAGLTLSRDTALEQRAAGFLLGEAAASDDQGGGIYSYQSAGGQALFRSSGGFEAAGRLSEEPEDFCRDFCRTFSYEEPVFLLDEEGNGSASAVCVRGGLPVFNCTVRFTVEGGCVTAVSGTLLPEGGVPVQGTDEVLSAAGALTAFQRMRRENAAVASSVTGTQLCYELQNTGAAISLTPAWQVMTDTADYYVNCVSGTVTAG